MEISNALSIIYSMNKQLTELLYQALETEMGGVSVYETAIQCAINKDLRKEWEKYLEQTQNHVNILEDLFHKIGLDPERDTPGRGFVQAKVKALVDSMQKSLQVGRPENAQLVAAEAVLDAETKDHLNWELIGEASKEADPELGKYLREAFDEVEDEEDEHLYHTMGWTRELWLDSIGVPAVLPPPEERKEADTAVSAARAKHHRTRMIKKHRIKANGKRAASRH